MIPKNMHFVWLGPEMPNIYKRSLDRWIELHPDYNIHLWENIPNGMPQNLKDLINFLPYYCQKSDIIRYWVVWKFGGVCFDLDEFPYRNIDELLIYRSFTAKQYSGHVACACLGSEKEGKTYGDILKVVDQRWKAKMNKRCDYGPSLKSLPIIRRSFQQNGGIIGPDSWFYIEPPKKKNECVKFALSSLKEKDEWIEKRRNLFKDGVTPFAVHLWGWEGSSFRKA